MERDDKLEKVVLHCYKELYKMSTPSADFDELVKNASINQFGQKEIPYMDYEIEEALFHSILHKVLSKYKLDTWDIDRIKNTIYLGCSPKFKKS
jgi:hypothetical protein